VAQLIGPLESNTVKQRNVRPFAEQLSAECAGAVLIEYAIALPLLLLLVFGIVEYGQMFREYEAAINAAREGARMAVLPGYTEQDVQDRVASFLAASGLTTAQPTDVAFAPVPLGGGVAPLSAFTVTVHVRHSSLLPAVTLYGTAFGLQPVLNASASMRTEVAAGGS
jgi:Flp pilus assembly protein TadG